MKDPEAEILQAMQAADLPPEFAYAYKKTGLLGLSKDKSQWPADRVAEWKIGRATLKHVAGIGGGSVATTEPDALDKLAVALTLHEAAGDRKITVETKLLRWLVNRAKRKG